MVTYRHTEKSLKRIGMAVRGLVISTAVTACWPIAVTTVSRKVVPPVCQTKVQ
jgi:hypothetical protein